MNKYVINEQIGKGAFGKVRMGMVKATGQIVAVKSIPINDKKKSYTNIELNHRVNKVERESNVMKILSKDRCPYIIKYIDSFNYFNNHLIFMEMCHGGNLHDYCKKHGAIEESVARKTTRVILNALIHMHNNGIIYGDLKPSNIMLKLPDKYTTCSLHNQIKLIDFGCSRILENPDERQHGVAGTPVYMAPEVYKGDYGTLSDMWSLGVTLYYLLSLKLPLLSVEDSNDQISFQTAKGAICHGSFDFEHSAWRYISAECMDFIKMCINKEYERITPIDALRHPWIT